MLGLISFLTTGVIEARAWTIENGTKAPQAAGVIHTDFEKKFIKADCISFGDFVAAEGWKKARELGKVRVEGKEYVMRNGDIVEFKIGT
jgi:ribosome-binding ATPase YchF (GTP1/OBG family)